HPCVSRSATNKRPAFPAQGCQRVHTIRAACRERHDDTTSSAASFPGARGLVRWRLGQPYPQRLGQNHMCRLIDALLLEVVELLKQVGTRIGHALVAADGRFAADVAAKCLVERLKTLSQILDLPDALHGKPALATQPNWTLFCVKRGAVLRQ